VVAESGIETHEDILRMRSYGINAFLVGTALLKSDDIITKLKSLKGTRV